jgi:hypothetical protein
MLTLEQLIAAATALPDAGKAILIDKIVESMTGQIDSSAYTKGDRDILTEGVQKAQERLDEIDSGAVQTVPGDVGLAQIRQLYKKRNMNFTRQPCKNTRRLLNSLPSKTNNRISSTP